MMQSARASSWLCRQSESTATNVTISIETNDQCTLFIDSSYCKVIGIIRLVVCFFSAFSSLRLSPALSVSVAVCASIGRTPPDDHKTFSCDYYENAKEERPFSALYLLLFVLLGLDAAACERPRTRRSDWNDILVSIVNKRSADAHCSTRGLSTIGYIELRNESSLCVPFFQFCFN